MQSAGSTKPDSESAPGLHPSYSDHDTRDHVSKREDTARSSLSIEAWEGSRRDASGSIYSEGAPGQKRDVTRAQKWRVWSSCALQAFWIMGINQSFGIFQAHYGSDKAVQSGIIRPEDETKRAGIAAIQSLGNGGIVAACAMLFYARLPLIGRHIRTLCFASTALTTVGFAVAAASHNLWSLVLTQGVCVGLGDGVFFNVLPTILPEYFGRHSGGAQGAAVATGSVGAVALSLGLPPLLKSVGTRWTLGILSIVSIFILGTSSWLAQPPRECRRRRTKLVGWKPFKNPTFTLLFFVNLIHPLTIAIPTTFGPEFSRAVGYSGRMASILLAISSAVGIPSRIVMGWTADFVGHNNMLLLATLTYGFSTLTLWLWAAQTNQGAVWIVYNIVYGCVFGVFTTVINSVQMGHFGDELYYPYNGVLTSIRGVGYVIGSPLAGSLVSRIKDSDLDGADFNRVIVYTGVLLTVSACCLAGVRWIDARKNGWKWVI